MGKEMSGLPDTSPRSMTSYDYWDAMCAGVRQKKVTPLITPPRSSEGSAWNAKVIELCSVGLIPQIYASMERPDWVEVPWEALLLRLKDTGQLLSEIYYVVSTRGSRILLWYSFSKQTDGSPKGSPSTPTTSPDTCPPGVA